MSLIYLFPLLSLSIKVELGQTIENNRLFWIQRAKIDIKLDSKMSYASHMTLLNENLNEILSNLLVEGGCGQIS